jgi:prepilin-type N-terminal cleavage/methylation domain-containing protein
MSNDHVAGSPSAGLRSSFHLLKRPLFRLAMGECLSVRSGFTLVELLLVLVLLVVAASFALPNFSRSYQDLLTQRVVEDLVYSMRYAQSRAVVQEQFVCLTLADDQRSYWLEELTSVDRETGQEFSTPLPGSWGRLKKIPEQIRIENLERIHFYPDGTIEKAAFSVCREQRCQTISTREQRGRVVVYEGNENVAP